ncbi:MAG: hypothetical protein NZ903_01745, partial [Candidatus Micrarchaeota archaeon]|nr:hypothetical protein [Candidatus Micrarchaeota archaeon]
MKIEKGRREFIYQNPRIEDVKKTKSNEINLNKIIGKEKAEARLREAKRRLKRCRLRWQKIEALKLIESVIMQKEIDEEIYVKAKEILE